MCSQQTFPFLDVKPSSSNFSVKQSPSSTSIKPSPSVKQSLSSASVATPTTLSNGTTGKGLVDKELIDKEKERADRAMAQTRKLLNFFVKQPDDVVTYENCFEMKDKLLGMLNADPEEDGEEVETREEGVYVSDGAAESH
ncbi:unnamed protein product [Cylicostephanus goldi]|uniref:Uncharacterized protein n=1 Tax=Cylicostephanus goldi TaxID=71465 RepID=A0A3P7NA86_CYLGO|nr:unnamed protein product [Cylicostephanus goldi]